MTLAERWKVIALVIGGISLVGGAITAVHAAWPIVDPYVLAHRGYVVEKIGGVQTTTNELLQWKFEDTKAKLRADADGWNIQMQKENDPQTKTLIQKQIQQLNVEQQNIDERIRKLKGQ